MAHYAFINTENKVVEVITGKNEDEQLPNGFSSWEEYYESKREGVTCLRTSYNTRDNVYYDADTNEVSEDQSKAFRGNYAGVGMVYDSDKNIFLADKPFPSWIWDSTIGNLGGWKAPIDEPAPEDNKAFEWNEEITNWNIYQFNTDLEMWELVE